MQQDRQQSKAAADALAGVATLPASAAGHRERLTITEVELFRVCPPLQEGILPKAAAADFDVIPKYIIKVHTDAGIVGLGETHRMGGGPDSEAVVRLKQAAELLKGRNVLDFNLARLELPVPTDLGAFEAAFYDILGKAVGWPVWRLLGGLAQRRIPVHYWAGKGLSPEELKALAEKAVALGFAGVKMKRFNPLPQALEIFASVSPKLKITVDLMGHYAGEFLPVVRELEAVGNVLAIEDPPPQADALDAYRELRQQMSIPVAMHLYINREGVRGMVRAISAESCSIFNLGAGSMAEFVARAYLAGEAGIAVWHGSAHELGILDAAMLHACAAAPNCTCPSDILSHQRVHNLLATPIEFRDSYATVPEGPGLGVELDMDAVHRYAVEA
ncbi:MAG: enolase C-terminal domain-like protein [Candidatus Latescibacterota bacterium]|jgi:muconate cycloisomerase